jgi:hypothetical protein
MSESVLSEGEELKNYRIEVEKLRQENPRSIVVSRHGNIMIRFATS